MAAQWLGLCGPTTSDVGSIPGWGSKILQAMEHAPPSPPKETKAGMGHSLIRAQGWPPQLPLHIQTPQGPLLTFSACSLSGQPLPQWLPINAQAPP